jgi:hypothetical protein
MAKKPFRQFDILDAEQYPVAKALQRLDDGKQVKKVPATRAPFPDAQ